uniref:Uncharacterized protein n=1 Tax=Anopheles albimanus TaxID=7167 RepID=A0A182FWM1_ANOAL
MPVRSRYFDYVFAVHVIKCRVFG